MKKILVGFALLGAVLAGCKKEDTKKDDNNNNNPGTVTIPETQRATVFYFGGTWCPPCGANGKPAKEAIKEQAASKAVVISCQVNSSSVQDPMNNADANALASMFRVSQVPSMFIGSAGQPFGSVPSNSSMSANAVTAVNSAAARTPVTNCIVKLSESDGLINVKVDGKFFADAVGEFHIAGYLLESKLNFTQASDNSKEKNIHHDILREKFGTSITGTLIKLDPKKDDTYKADMSFFPGTKYKKENCSIAVVIWQKTSTGWTVSNSIVTKLQ
ncbi:MAG: hypothetical protein ACK4K9_08930 [Bacteroidia bacterium]